VNVAGLLPNAGEPKLPFGCAKARSLGKGEHLSTKFHVCPFCEFRVLIAVIRTEARASKRRQLVSFDARQHNRMRMLNLQLCTGMQIRKWRRYTSPSTCKINSTAVAPSRHECHLRNRGELNFSNGDLTWRYRLQFERQITIGSHHPHTYANV